jgi:hypothetical protein
VWLLVGNDCSPQEAVAGISPVPLLIIHGRDDRIVPYHHGEHLLEAAKEPKELWALPGGHTSAFVTGGEGARTRVLEKMRAWVGAER